jgi:myo-inositol-1(or 4)-monophosphatase
MEDLQIVKKIALKAALEAGKLLIELRRNGFDTNHKSARDLVTSADLAAEKLIINHIKENFPNHYILSEEASPEATLEILRKDAVWIIDPIDGTTNFAHGHHQVGISIAFVANGKVQAGVVHAPFLNETFSAIRNSGAYLNDKQFVSGECKQLVNALVATGFPYQRDNTSPIVKRFEAILNNCRDIRRLGAASLDICWVACGRLDAYYESVMVWDMAAASLVAIEAGAVVDHFSEVPEEWWQLKDLYAKDLLVSKASIVVQLKHLLE